MLAPPLSSWTKQTVTRLNNFIDWFGHRIALEAEMLFFATNLQTTTRQPRLSRAESSKKRRILCSKTFYSLNNASNVLFRPVCPFDHLDHVTRVQSAHKLNEHRLLHPVFIARAHSVYVFIIPCDCYQSNPHYLMKSSGIDSSIVHCTVIFTWDKNSR